MGDAPKLLGGAAFAIPDVSDGADAGAVLLTQIAATLGQAGDTTKKIKRGRPDDVRCRCDRGHCRIELILVTQPAAASGCPSLLLAFDFSKSIGPAAHCEASRTWDEMYGIIDTMLINRFNGGRVNRLTATEAAAHC
jgi:hypothetical protein